MEGTALTHRHCSKVVHWSPEEIGQSDSPPGEDRSRSESGADEVDRYQTRSEGDDFRNMLMRMMKKQEELLLKMCDKMGEKRGISLP